MKMKITTNLKGLKKFAWKRNLTGFFTCNGRALSDAEVRRVVEYGISKGYRTEADIPGTEVEQLLTMKENKENIVQLSLFTEHKED